MDRNRKGARSAKDIPDDIMAQLNAGQIESANLVEWLAIDQLSLLKGFLEQADRNQYLAPVINRIEQLKKKSVNTLNEAIGTELLSLARQHSDDDLFSFMAQHPADMVRCWAAYFVGGNDELSINAKLTRIQPFAADRHFGVREVGWIAVRPTIIQQLSPAIDILAKWTSSSDTNIRRFASEATRPRGVWCPHIEELKQNPALALSILEPLKSDSARYVQDSVGNWLNDASKTQPEFVVNLCQKWTTESPTKETAYIVKKALRALNK